MIQSLHTHTTFCDGKNTVEEMVLASVKKNLKSIGFSGHSPITGEDWCITDLTAYKQEIVRLKEKYRDNIEIFLGIELDYCYPIDTTDFDYVISSVHGVLRQNKPLWVDYSKESFKEIVEFQYQGNAISFVQDYYNLVAKAATKGDILGHFDLITKFNKDKDLFDEQSAIYKNIALAAIEKVLKTGIIIELNTGAIQRGYLDRCYPDSFLLDVIKQRNGKIIVTTDAHSCDGIDFHYQETVKLLKDIGFTQQMQLSNNGFITVDLY